MILLLRLSLIIYLEQKNNKQTIYILSNMDSKQTQLKLDLGFGDKMYLLASAPSIYHGHAS